MDIQAYLDAGGDIDTGDSVAETSADEEFQELRERHDSYETAAEEKGYDDVNSWDELYDAIFDDWCEYWSGEGY